MQHHTPHTPRYGRPGARLILILSLTLAILLAAIAGFLLLRSTVDPLARQAAEVALARQQRFDSALGRWDTAIEAMRRLAWCALPIALTAGAGAAAIAIAWRQWGWGESVLAAHDTRHAAAIAQRFPAALQTLTFTDSHRAEGVPADLLAGLLAAPNPNDVIEGEIIPDPPQGLPDIMRRGLGSAAQLYVGQGTGGPQTIALKHAGFIAIAGVQGSGKSNTESLLAAQIAAAGGLIYVIDPHAGDTESLANRLQPLSGRIARIAKTPEEINRLIAIVDGIYHHRDANPGAHVPLLLAIDEFMALALRGVFSDAAQQALLALSGEGRKKAMVTSLASQNWGKNLVGVLGTALRQNTTHAIVHASKVDTASYLLPGAYYAKKAAQLRPGQAILFGGGGEPVDVAVPELSVADLQFAAAGTAPRPYAPWPAHWLTPRGAKQSPTQPIARAPAPPTAPMNITVQEQILDLLAAQPWLTRTAIAARIRADGDVVGTELSSLKAAGRVVSRRVSGGAGDRLEWACSTVQPLNRSTVASAA